MSEHKAESGANLLTEREREMLYAADRRMDAYYYSFDPTGVPEIDAILSAVAHAGKGYHHTDMWGDTPGPDEKWARFGPGRSMVDVIQAAANVAARALGPLPDPGPGLRGCCWDGTHPGLPCPGTATPPARR